MDITEKNDAIVQPTLVTPDHIKDEATHLKPEEHLDHPTRRWSNELILVA